MSTEVPTIFISTSLPNHLIDVPMVKTVIHAHAPTREAIRATVEKIQGLSAVPGHVQRERLVRHLRNATLN